MALDVGLELLETAGIRESVSVKIKAALLCSGCFQRVTI